MQAYCTKPTEDNFNMLPEKGKGLHISCIWYVDLTPAACTIHSHTVNKQFIC